MTPAELTSIRTSRGWTQERLAEELGISPRTVARWERTRTKHPRICLPVKRALRTLAEDALQSPPPPEEKRP